MPLVRISLRKGKPAGHIEAIRDGVYLAMRETFNVPENDRFILVHEHDDTGFDYDPAYPGLARTGDVVFIQITANNTRTVEQKQALYRRIADRLAESPGLRGDDVFISLVEVAKENWSFGNGIAQYV
ncbi:tautomerase family protein [Inquilinus limosus]|uniref:Tautomerase family protein n=1 Tax=Inquilinus limosus TaxID=171674 RepID=A0A211ZNR7_9PROT|nr:tautomerase family protein [Inquilinus limosus]OWJ66889.1 tautomerase family protein [Inquilinus limosus]